MPLLNRARPLPRSRHHAAAFVLAACAGALLAGCAAAPATAGPAAASPPLAGASDAAAPAPAPVDPLPRVTLDGELLFRLMVGEIAAQRGDAAMAYGEFIRAARQTHDPRIARRAAEIAIGARALAQALEATELWHALAPHDAEADQSYVSLLIANGRHDDARPILRRQIAAASNPIEVLDRVQRVLVHAPEPAQGLALLEGLARPYYSQPAYGFDAHLIAARGARAAGDHAAAVRHARAALALQPESELATMIVAQLLVEGAGVAPAPGTNGAADPGAAGRAEALGLLAAFVKRQPAAGEVRQMYARLLVGDGRLDEGRQQFEELLRRDPLGPDPLFALGVLALEAERYADARGYLERYLAALGPGADRDMDLACLNMARVAEGQRRFDEALEWLHKVRGPEQIDTAHEREAFLLGRMNRVDEGMQLLQQLPAATPEQRIQNVLAQGQLLRDAHRYGESFRLLDQALQEHPDDTGLLYEAAMSAERLDRLDLMETRLRHLLQLRPDYAHAYNALGYSLADRNIRLQEAYQLIDHALSLAPDDGFIVDSMGWVQYRMGNLAAAREALTRAFRLKADPDVAAHLGEVLWASGDHSAARTVLLDAQRRDGDSDTLRDTLQRLKIRP